MSRLASTSVGQVVYLAKWCGLEVTVPAGMMLSKPLQVEHGQLATLLASVDKHQRVESLESRLATAEAQVNTLEQIVLSLGRSNGTLGSDNDKLKRTIDKLNIDNDILRCRAVPEMDAHTANVFIRALGRVMALMRLRARLTFRKQTDLSPLHEKFRNAVINSLTH